jgi:hypothetical protein
VATSFNQLLEDLNDARIRAGNLVQGLSPVELTRRPEPARWSIAECLVQLNTTAALVQRLMTKGVEHGRKEKILGKEPFELGPKGRLLIWIATPPPKFRMSAPKAVAPPVKIADPAGVLPEFLRAQDGWERLLREAEGLDMSRIKVGPLFSVFRCRLSAAFPWMMAHQRRHLLQAENVKRQIFSAAFNTTTKAS